MKYYLKYSMSDYGEAWDGVRRDVRSILYTCRCGAGTEWWHIGLNQPICSEECAGDILSGFLGVAPQTRKETAERGDIIQVVNADHSSLTGKEGLCIIVQVVGNEKVYGSSFKGSSAIWVFHGDYVVIGQSAVIL